MSLIALASLVVTQAPITLVFQPKVGATYKYSLSTKSNNPMMGANDILVKSSLKVLSFANGQYKIESKFDGGSKNAGNQTLNMLVDKFGNMKLTGSKAPSGMESAMASMGSSATGITMPKKAVKIGESWSSEFDMGKMMNEGFKQAGPQGSKMASTGKVKTTYKLLKVTGSTVEVSSTISGSSTMSISGLKQANAPSSMNMKMKISGSGKIVVERSTGLPLNSTYKTNMAMTVMGQAMDTVVTNVYKRI